MTSLSDPAAANPDTAHPAPLRRLVIRGGSVLLCTGLIQLLAVPPITLSDDARRLAEALQSRPSVVFFGDSTNRWTDEEDTDRRAISQVLGDLLQSPEILALDSGAWHPEVFAAFLEAAVRNNYRPDTIVIPVNLRAFSAEWHSRPQYAFRDLQAELRYLESPWRRGLTAPMKMLGLSPQETRTDYASVPVCLGEQVVGTVSDFSGSYYDQPTPEKTRNKFILHYMYSLHPEHPKVQALQHMKRIAAENHIRAVFYITPVDVETGRQLLPDCFGEQLQRNIDTLQAALDGADVLDLSGALQPAAFSWHDYPNEHLCESGRHFVAGQVADAIQSRPGLHLHGHITKPSPNRTAESSRRTTAQTSTTPVLPASTAGTAPANTHQQ